jgi:hypothetical protein
LARRHDCQAIDLEARGRRLHAARGRSEHPQRRGVVRLRARPHKDRLEGRGKSPEDELLALTVKLKELDGAEAAPRYVPGLPNPWRAP